MGDLIVMTRPAYSVRRDLPKDDSANVLFFTGVRYARAGDAEAAPASIAAPRRVTRPRRGPNKNGSAKRA